ncbi:MAG: PAS domain S-box protein [Chitinispirillaceae bacterium]
MQKRLTSLRSRLKMLVYTIVVIFMVLLIGTKAYWFYTRYRQETENSLELARAVSLTFQALVRDVQREQYALGVARELLTTNGQQTFNDYLSLVDESYYAVRNFFIVDSSGIIVSSSEFEAVGIDITDRGYFQRLKGGDSTVVSSFLRTKTDSTPSFVIARGFYNSLGQFEYGVLATVQIDRLGRINLRLELDEGYFTLFDRQGTLIYTSQHLDTLTDSMRRWWDDDPLLRKALRGEETTGFFDPPVGEGGRVGARVPMEEYGWVAGVAVPVSVFFGPFVLPLVVVFVISIAVTVVTLLIARRTVDSINGTLLTVKHHLNSVSRGEFTTIEPASGLSEFDELIFNTNTMALELREREERLRLLASVVQNSESFIGLASAELVLYFVNEAGRRMVGLGKNEVGEVRMIDYFAMEDREYIENEVMRSLLENGRWSGEVRFRSFKTGESIPVMWNTFAIKDDKGHLLAWAMIGTDLTQLTKAREEYRKSELRVRAILGSLAEGIAFFNSRGEVVDSNPSLSRILGWSLEEIMNPEPDIRMAIKRSDGTSMPPREQPVMITLRTGEPVYNVEQGVYRPDGTFVWISANAHPVQDEESNVIGAVASYFDITERKRVEDALRRSEERFRELADSMPQLVWTADPDGTVDYYNQRYKDFGGIAPESDGTWRWGPVLHEEDLKPTLDAFSQSLRTGEIYQIEHRVKHADGSFHWYLSRAVPVRDESGRTIKWYGTATNIDISKEAQAALAENEKRLKVLNENLESMVVKRTEQVRTLSRALTIAEQRERKRFSYVLHENLQQLLLGAKMLLAQHLRDHQGASQVKEYDDVEDGVSLLERALSTTRTLSIELNPPVLRTQGLDVALRWLVTHMRKNYGLDVKLEIEGGVDQIRGENQLMLTQMVRELLANVVQHSGVKNALVNAAYADNLVRISVEDSGRGFDVRDVLRETADETRMGLFSIKERLRLFGGELTVESEENKGTRSVITLPLEVRS